jgi:hypothetical protein
MYSISSSVIITRRLGLVRVGTEHCEFQLHIDGEFCGNFVTYNEAATAGMVWTGVEERYV